MLTISYFYDTVSVDVDNVIKPFQDALKGLVYEDDVQVTDVLSRRRNLSGDFRVGSVSSIVADAFIRGNEFLYILVEDVPDQEVLG
jgi:crossover junction endodeoxyribonuclease RusA